MSFMLPVLQCLQLLDMLLLSQRFNVVWSQISLHMMIFYSPAESNLGSSLLMCSPMSVYLGFFSFFFFTFWDKAYCNCCSEAPNTIYMLLHLLNLDFRATSSLNNLRVEKNGFEMIIYSKRNYSSYYPKSGTCSLCVYLSSKSNAYQRNYMKVIHLWTNIYKNPWFCLITWTLCKVK